ncbi:MAG TPA: hypothetical protein VGK78_18960 [Nocardioides sp.]|uniref:hypothetical protein n=1 Tax=Nocardioides sp. TaxID=35761 RepID=UPI002F3E24FD
MSRSRFAPIALLSSLALLVGGAAADPAVGLTRTAQVNAARSTLPAPTTSHHYIANVGSATRAVKRLGYTVIDVGAVGEEIRNLPAHTQGLVWLGQDCPTRANRAFKRVIRRFAHSPKVFGYYLADEPHKSGCRAGPAALATRADYIRKQSGGVQQSFIVLDDSYHAFRPWITHVTMVGIDPYPCSTGSHGCDFTEINDDLGTALNAGIPRRTVVPTYQAFGQENTSSHYYNLPTRDQMRAMLHRWARLVPHPPMDYTYGWGHQDSANPTLRDSTGLKRLFSRYFAG